MEEKRKLQPGRFKITQQVEKKLEKPTYPDFKGLWNDGGNLKSISFWCNGTFGQSDFNISGSVEPFKSYSAKPSDPEPKPMTDDESKMKFAAVRAEIAEGVPPQAIEQSLPAPPAEEDDVPF
tara:strand:+ start:139 stop:504 length:366 start_codon:yes stop_codon:yes gene_type:complete